MSCELYLNRAIKIIKEYFWDKSIKYTIRGNWKYTFKSDMIICSNV